MDWITGIQKAIDYVEENLTEELDYAAVAAKAYVSSFHFQRLFTIMCGFSLGEYIRCRRLTLAGAELNREAVKVIDAALKYGYDSPDSFAKAFTRFHGITPSAAREPGAQLRSFSRLSIKVSLEGGNTMDYRIEKKQAFKVAGKTQTFKTSEEHHRDDIPAFWGRCHIDGTVETLSQASRGTGMPGIIFGICYSEDPNAGEFPYMIGVAHDVGPVPDGYTVMEIPAHTWAMFRCVGAMPRAIQDLWHQIYTEFFPTSEYRPVSGIDLEAYYDGDMNDPAYVSEIWIPVKSK
jgi:AraC family transcriptional regulator